MNNLEPPKTQFLHLNVENAWPQFRLHRIQSGPEGELALARVPKVDARISELPSGPETFVGPAGVGIDSAGNVYFADPASHRIFKWNACDEKVCALPCVGGYGCEPGRLNTPRGVIIGPRERLYVADSGNHRVAVWDLQSGQLVDVWPSERLSAADKEAVGLDEPWDLAADSTDSIFVVDHGRQSVEKFTVDGISIPEFWKTLKTQPGAPIAPVAVTVAIINGEERILIVDAKALVICRSDGTIDATAGGMANNLVGWWERLAIKTPTGVVMQSDLLYIGDADSGRVLTFDAAGRFIGEARGLRGPVAGLNIDHLGRLLVNGGPGGSVTRLRSGEAYCTEGSFLAGPFALPTGPIKWHRAVAITDPLPAAAHLGFFAATEQDYQLDPQTGALMVSAGQPTADPAGLLAIDPAETWSAAPIDATEFILPQAPARKLWLYGVLSGDSSATPVIRQIRLEYEHVSWMEHLPSFYRRGDRDGFLDRFLALLESGMEAYDTAISTLYRQFSFRSAGAENSPNSWLDWLATWLDLEMDENWPEQTARLAIAGAFRSYEMRGTARGLRDLIRLYSGARALIEEPSRGPASWILGSGELGFGSSLAAAKADGAVLGTTAVLGGSEILVADENGTPLFDDVAHCFTVSIMESDVPAGVTAEARINRIRELIEREKPAHSAYQLCLIGARMRVGVQARVGVDSIVAGPPPDLSLGGAGRLGFDASLAPGRGQDRAIVGEARTGQSARVV